MLNNFSKSITMSAVSAVTNEAGEVTNVMYMNATISGSGSLNINQSIQDAELYALRADEVNLDYEAFREKVLELSGSYAETEA